MKVPVAPDQSTLFRLADWAIIAQGVRSVWLAFRAESIPQVGVAVSNAAPVGGSLALTQHGLARRVRDWSTEVVLAVSGKQAIQQPKGSLATAGARTQRTSTLQEAAVTAREADAAASEVVRNLQQPAQYANVAATGRESSALPGTLVTGIPYNTGDAVTPSNENAAPANLEHSSRPPPLAREANASTISENDVGPELRSRRGSSYDTTPDPAVQTVHHRVGQEEEQTTNAFTERDVRNSAPRRSVGEARRVPATTVERMFGFGNLALGIVWNAAKSSLLSAAPTKERSGLERYLSPENADRIARTLCRMRGAALKLGQMLSMQDERTVPPILLQALERARQGADFMPRRQLERVLRQEWGPDWQQRVHSFNFEPVAAASIGQVHRASVREQNHERPIAVKVQYPGVAASIESDLKNLKRLLTYTNLIPRGLYLDEAIRVAREELLCECDYELEAANQVRFAALFQGFDQGHVHIPRVLASLSTRNVLTTEWVDGEPLDRLVSLGVPAAQRNKLAVRMLRLTLHELFEKRFMQTDPNFSNFLYEIESDTLHLLDFGAARSYPKAFVDAYLHLVMACANRDRAGILEWSQQLGFLTGEESRLMLDAHCEAAFVVGEPFSAAFAKSYEFASSNIAVRAARFGQVMLQHRLCPPPREAYSLHRRLSGAFLTCMRLQANIPCRTLLEEVYTKHDWRPEGESEPAAGDLPVKPSDLVSVPQ
jgi:aarF domain-containing kinase